jgi:hypothetical protein
MKKLLVVSAIALFGAMNAQKNTILVGGNISLESVKNKSNSTTTSEGNAFEFNPTIGYQFADNWTAGVRLGVGTEKITMPITATSYEATKKTNTFTYGVFGRYTLPLNETFAAFGDLDVYAGNGKLTYSSNVPGDVSSTSKTTNFGVKFTPNLFINFKNSFGLNFNIGSLGYETNKLKDSDIKTNSFGFGFGKGVTVGISKNFGLK